MKPEIIFASSAFKHGLTQEDILHAFDTDITNDEYDALDKELTRTIPKLGPNGTGFLSRREMHFLGLSNLTVK
ncbi:MAG: hypothetical protein FWF29_03585 [Treponema sp.]|nr:hypothetical protein [Treponema sp.]